MKYLYYQYIGPVIWWIKSRFKKQYFIYYVFDYDEDTTSDWWDTIEFWFTPTYNDLSDYFDEMSEDFGHNNIQIKVFQKL